MDTNLIFYISIFVFYFAVSYFIDTINPFEINSSFFKSFIHSLIRILIIIIINLIISVILNQFDGLFTTELIKTYNAIEKSNENNENFIEIVDDYNIKIIHKKDKYKIFKKFNINEYETDFENTNDTSKINLYKYKYKHNLLNIFCFCFKNDKIIVYDKDVDNLINNILIPE